RAHVVHAAYVVEQDGDREAEAFVATGRYRMRTDDRLARTRNRNRVDGRLLIAHGCSAIISQNLMVFGFSIPPFRKMREGLGRPPKRARRTVSYIEGTSQNPRSSEA